MKKIINFLFLLIYISSTFAKEPVNENELKIITEYNNIIGNMMVTLREFSNSLEVNFKENETKPIQRYVPLPEDQLIQTNVGSYIKVINLVKSLNECPSRILEKSACITYSDFQLWVEKYIRDMAHSEPDKGYQMQQLAHRAELLPQIS